MRWLDVINSLLFAINGFFLGIIFAELRRESLSAGTGKPAAQDEVPTGEPAAAGVNAWAKILDARKADR